MEEGGRGAHREPREEERIEESQRDLLYRRLDLPLFDGEGTLDWLARVKRYI